LLSFSVPAIINIYIIWCIKWGQYGYLSEDKGFIVD